MKPQFFISILSVCGLVVSSVGCGKKQDAPEHATPVTPPAISKTMTGTVQRVSDTAEGQTVVVKPPTVPVASVTQTQAVAAQSQVEDAVAKTQGLIDQARRLLTEKKWAEALNLLTELSGQKLTPEQQSLVQGLQDQARKAGETAAKTKASDEAAKAVEGLLTPRK